MGGAPSNDGFRLLAGETANPYTFEPSTNYR